MPPSPAPRPVALWSPQGTGLTTPEPRRPAAAGRTSVEQCLPTGGTPLRTSPTSLPPALANHRRQAQAPQRIRFMRRSLLQGKPEPPPSLAAPPAVGEIAAAHAAGAAHKSCPVANSPHGRHLRRRGNPLPRPEMAAAPVGTCREGSDPRRRSRGSPG